MRNVAVQRYARLGHLAVAWLFTAGVVVQVFLAGLALFADAGDFRDHVAFGYSAYWIVALLIPVLALVGRLPRREIGLSFLLVVLYIVQCLLPPIARTGGPGFIAALHPVNAMLLFAIGVAVAVRGWRGLRSADAQDDAALGTR